MKINIFLCFLLSLCLCSYVLAEPNAAPGQFLIRFSDASVSQLRRQNAEMSAYSNDDIKESLIQLTGLQKLEHFRELDTYFVATKKNEAINLQNIDQFKREGILVVIEPNYRRKRSVVPNDPSFSKLWGLRNTGQSGGKAGVDIDAANAWQLTQGSKDVVVGILDGAVDYTHSDLAANMWVNSGDVVGDGLDNDNNGVVDDVYGYNAVENNGTVSDFDSHGSHCGGVVGAVGNNGKGVVGVNWKVSIMSLQCFASSGDGYVSDELEALDYALMMRKRGVNLRVINASFGSSDSSDAEEDAFRELGEWGVLFTVAAGNEYSNLDESPSYPANYNLTNIISVAAVDRKGDLADFSNFSENLVHIAAPGVGILSTVPGGYEEMDGTSMAAPNVAGVAALLVSRNPSLSAESLRKIIVGNYKPISSLTGYLINPGVVNAYNALLAVDAYTPTIPELSNVTIVQNAGSKVITINASDPNTSLNYSASIRSTPTNVATLSFNGNKLTVTPKSGYTGSFVVEVVVSDGTYTASRYFTVTVRENKKPVITAVANNRVFSGGRLYLPVAVYDPDGDQVTVRTTNTNQDILSAELLRSSLVIVANSGKAGVADVTIKASDGYETTEESIEIEVSSIDVSLLADTDLDDVTDIQELVDGTNVSDRGSAVPRLGEVINSAWNSFLNMYNVLELVNVSYRAKSPVVKLYSSNGTLLSQKKITIAAGKQADIIVNDLPGFAKNSIGIIRIENGSGIDGRMTFYQQTSGGETNFAFGVPFSGLQRGETFLPFNTFSPNLSSLGSENRLENWLTITNLSSKGGRFAVKTYDQSGSVIKERRVYLKARGRVDLDGGHGLAGLNKIGYHRIVPLDNTLFYSANITRYGYDVNGTVRFAYVMPAKAATGEVQTVPVDNSGQQENWAEIVNASSRKNTVGVTVRDNGGNLRHSNNYILKPFTTKHINVSQYLGSAPYGYAQIDSNLKESVTVNNVVYDKNRADGKIAAVYNTVATEPQGLSLNSSYNRYLGLNNLLRVTNTSSSSAENYVRVQTPQGSVQKRYVVRPYKTLQIDLNQDSVWGTRTDSFGTVNVQTPKANRLFGVVLRESVEGNETNYLIPVSLR